MFSVPPTAAAFTAIAFAALLYGLHHAADAAVRRRLCAPNLLVFAGLLGIILLLIGWVTLLDALWPGLGENPLVDAAAIGGLVVGKNLPGATRDTAPVTTTKQQTGEQGSGSARVAVALPMPSQLGALRTALSSDIPPSSPA